MCIQYYYFLHKEVIANAANAVPLNLDLELISFD